MNLSKKTRKALTGSKITEMAVELGVSPGSIYNWLKSNPISPMLTTIKTIEAIEKITNIKQSEIFDK